jgi:hypothetical protein
VRASSSVLLVALGCSSVMADRDGRIHGEDLGRFSVTAELERSTCGAGALGTPTSWAFEVLLSREHPVLYWNQGGAAVEGDLGPDGVFRLESVTEIPVELPEDGVGAGCVMRRLDRASGQLDEVEGAVHGFVGALTYRFVQSPGSDCSGLVGVAGGFERLPCEIEFQLHGELIPAGSGARTEPRAAGPVENFLN